MIMLGMFLIFFSNFIMSISFNNATGQLWGFYVKYDSNIAFLFTLFNILLGILLISQGVSSMYLSDFIIKRKDKMTWVILLVSGSLLWVGTLIIFIFLRNWLLITLGLVGCLSFIWGMLMPIKYYIEKPYKEY